MPQARAGREPLGERMGCSLALGHSPATAPPATPPTATTTLATGIRRSRHHEEQDDGNDVHPLRASQTGGCGNGQTDTETERAEREQRSPHGGEGGGRVRRGAQVPYITTGQEGLVGDGEGRGGRGRVLTQASCGDSAGPGAAGRRAVSNTAPPRMRCH